jgi:hypothetical protein
MREDGNARQANGARGEPLGKCAGFDASERAMGYRGQPLSRVAKAITVSKAAAARLARMKMRVHGTATDENMPFARHRTITQLWRDDARHALRRSLRR